MSAAAVLIFWAYLASPILSAAIFVGNDFDRLDENNLALQLPDARDFPQEFPLVTEVDDNKEMPARELLKHKFKFNPIKDLPPIFIATDTTPTETTGTILSTTTTTETPATITTTVKTTTSTATPTTSTTTTQSSTTTSTIPATPTTTTTTTPSTTASTTTTTPSTTVTIPAMNRPNVVPDPAVAAALTGSLLGGTACQPDLRAAAWRGIVPTGLCVKTMDMDAVCTPKFTEAFEFRVSRQACAGFEGNWCCYRAPTPRLLP